MQRVICRRGIDTETVQPGQAVEVYTPDPGAPDVAEIVSVLREAQSQLPRSAKMNTRDRVEKLLAILEGA